MKKEKSSGTPGWLFGNVWTTIVAPSIVAVIAGVVLYHFGMSGSKDDGKAPVPDPVVVNPSLDAAPPKNASEKLESKSAATSELHEFAK